MTNDKLTHNDTQFSLRGTILRKLINPLATTTFTVKQCTTIMKPVLSDGLPKAGIVCTVPRALVHGPLCYSGLNIPNLYSK